MVVNKMLGGNARINLAITNFFGTGTAQVWQLASANTISRLTDVAVNANAISNTIPAQSITLFVLPVASMDLRLRIGTNNPPGQLELWLDGQAGQSSVLQSSTDLTAWLPVSTNQMASNSFQFLVPVTNGAQKFYRAWRNPP